MSLIWKSAALLSLFAAVSLGYSSDDTDRLATKAFEKSSHQYDYEVKSAFSQALAQLETRQNPYSFTDLAESPRKKKDSEKEGCKNCDCEFGKDCNCKNCGTGTPYSQAYTAAVRDDIPLVVFVGVPVRYVPGCLVLWQKCFPDVDQPSIVIARPSNGTLKRLNDLPANATNESIRGALGVQSVQQAQQPVFSPPPIPFMGGGCGPGGCGIGGGCGPGGCGR